MAAVNVVDLIHKCYYFYDGNTFELVHRKMLSWQQMRHARTPVTPLDVPPPTPPIGTHSESHALKKVDKRGDKHDTCVSQHMLILSLI